MLNLPKLSNDLKDGYLDGKTSWGSNILHPNSPSPDNTDPKKTLKI
jgi:hypothetical protein